MPDHSNIDQLVDHLFREESGKMVATITRILGIQNLETAQDIVQDALIKAMQTWKTGQVPDNPIGWLHRTAKNQAIDFLRRNRRIQNITPEYAYILRSDLAKSSAFHQVFLESEITDSQLRMIFTCCHPAISPESQIAIILKTLGGLSTKEIARAFLTNEETITKRIYRAKAKFRSEKIDMIVPQGSELIQRLDVVLQSLYLLFNEGYHASHPDHHIREDLCHESMRLCHLLAGHSLTRCSKTYALMSLMCFQASRLNARLDDQGHIVLMAHQDRSKWFLPLIEKGEVFLQLASTPFEATSFHLQAVIASLHANSPSFESTNWKWIHELYSSLYQLAPSPIVAMNKAIACSYAISNEKALKELESIKGLSDHPVYLASLGEVYSNLNQTDSAKAHFIKALNTAQSKGIRNLMKKRIDECG